MAARPWLDTPSERRQLEIQIIGKYLRAIEEETLNPSSPTYDVNWTAEAGRAMPLEDIHHLLDRAYRSHALIGSVGLSPDVGPAVKLHAVRLLGRTLARAGKWNMFNLRLIHHMTPIRTTSYHFFPLLVSTALTFALPQLPPFPPVVLTSSSRSKRRWLWLKVGEYMAPAIASWWRTFRTPAVVLRLQLRRPAEASVSGAAVLTPQHINVNNFLSQNLLAGLAMNGMKQFDWEQPRVRQEELPRILSSCAGCQPSGEFNGSEISMDMAVLAIGIVARLQSQIPVLLVGDLTIGVDTRLASIVGKMLGATHRIVHSGDFVIGNFERSAEELRLSLAKCSEDALLAEDHGELDFLEALLIDHSAEVEWPFASIHCRSGSTQELQLQLPPALRHAVVFCSEGPVSSSV